MIKKIEFITCDSGDWEVLKVDGDIYHEGHSTPDYIWFELLSDLGVEIETIEISDEDMEYGRY